MLFEYNDVKSASNKQKHGIDFEQAKMLWNDSNLIEIPVITSDEPRHLVIGMMEDKHWTAIITFRNTHIRLISIRRARQSEVKLYESFGIR